MEMFKNTRENGASTMTQGRGLQDDAKILSNLLVLLYKDVHARTAASFGSTQLSRAGGLQDDASSKKNKKGENNKTQLTK